MKKLWIAMLPALLLMQLLLPQIGMAKETPVRLFLDDKLLKAEQPPRNVDGNVMIPVRIVTESLGAEVKWNQEEQKVTVDKGDLHVSFRIGRKEADVNGTIHNLEVAPINVEGTSLLPVRLIAEQMGLEINWDQEGQAVRLARKQAESKPDDGKTGGENGQALPNTPGPVGGGQKPSAAAEVTAIGFTDNKLTIKASGNVKPKLFTLSNPNRLVIELPNSKLSKSLKAGEIAGDSSASNQVKSAGLNGSEGNGLESSGPTQSPAAKIGENPISPTPNSSAKTGESSASPTPSPKAKAIASSVDAAPTISAKAGESSSSPTPSPNANAGGSSSSPDGATGSPAGGETEKGKDAVPAISSSNGGEFTTVHKAIGKIRFANFSNEPPVVRVVVDLNSKIFYNLEESASAGTIVVAFSDKETRPNPNGKYRVVIDAGHGDGDPGASSVTGRSEKEFTLAMALKVQKLLQQDSSIEVLMTREDDTFLELNERVDFANGNNADVFVSIHGNKFTAPNTRGTETYYWKEDSLELAKLLHEKILAAAGFPDRKVKNSDFRVIKYTSMPAVLCEIGFLSNVADEKQMFNEQFQTKVAEAIASGIKEYLKR